MRSAMTRAVVSVEPPGGNGEISVIARAGYDCAHAKPGTSALSAITASSLIMLSS
jgi:hypothetical protein